jgi:hypothetical protein
MKRWNLTCSSLLAVLSLVAAGPFAAIGNAQSLAPELEKLKTAFEKYQDPYVAVRDGYFSTVGCVEYPKPAAHGRVPYPAGGMGVHFLNPALIGPVVDVAKPPILIYEPEGAGKLRLVAVEFFVPLATGIKERPQLLGRPFDGPMEGHEPLLPQGLHHYDLHVWLWKPNPAGLFSPTNPNVKCTGYPFTLSEEAPQIVEHLKH